MRDYSLDTDQTDLFGFDRDTNSIRFLEKEELFGTRSETSIRRSGGPGRREFEQLKQGHARRSASARRVDERRSAEVTRDPLTWALAPDRYDFEGIDTVEPDRLHSRRSERARAADERKTAPLVDSPEQWARNPDRYDWQGVDTPRRSPRGMTGTRDTEPQLDSGLQMDRKLFGRGEMESMDAMGGMDDLEKLFDATRLDGSGGGGWF